MIGDDGQPVRTVNEARYLIRPERRVDDTVRIFTLADVRRAYLAGLSDGFDEAIQYDPGTDPANRPGPRS